MDYNFVNDRNGAGKDATKTLTDKVGTNDFRTAIITDGDKTTMLRTKGGMPEVTVVAKGVNQCGLFPLIERDETGGDTQDARVYYHDHEKHNGTAERRVFTADGIFSVVLRPLKRIIFHSVGLGKKIDLWLCDYSPTNAAQLQTAHVTQVEITPADKAALDISPVTAIEVFRHATPRPYESDEFHPDDDSTATIGRRYYLPKTITYTPEVATPANGVAAFVGRIKSVYLKARGISGYDGVHRVCFGHYNENTRSDAFASGARNGLVEKKIHTRVHDDIAPSALKSLRMAGGKVSVAEPYGFLDPLRAEAAEAFCPVENVPKNDGTREDLPILACSDIFALGQPWHGVLVTDAAAGTQVIYADPTMTEVVLQENNDEGAGPLCELLDDLGKPFFFYYNFPPAAARLPDVSAFCKRGEALTRDACLSEGFYSPLRGGTKLVESSFDATSLLYKDANGAVWNLVVRLARVTDNTVSVSVRVVARVDSFAEPNKAVNEAVIGSQLFEVEIAVEYGQTTHQRVKQSPDGTEFVVMLIDTGTAPAHMARVREYFTGSFQGVGVLDESGDVSGLSVAWAERNILGGPTPEWPYYKWYREFDGVRYPSDASEGPVNSTDMGRWRTDPTSTRTPEPHPLNQYAQREVTTGSTTAINSTYKQWVVPDFSNMLDVFWGESGWERLDFISGTFGTSKTEVLLGSPAVLDVTVLGENYGVLNEATAATHSLTITATSTKVKWLSTDPAGGFSITRVYINTSEGGEPYPETNPDISSYTRTTGVPTSISSNVPPFSLLDGFHSSPPPSTTYSSTGGCEASEQAFLDFFVFGGVKTVYPYGEVFTNAGFRPTQYINGEDVEGRLAYENTTGDVTPGKRWSFDPRRREIHEVPDHQTWTFF